MWYTVLTRYCTVLYKYGSLTFTKPCGVSPVPRLSLADGKDRQPTQDRRDEILGPSSVSDERNRTVKQNETKEDSGTASSSALSRSLALSPPPQRKSRPNQPDENTTPDRRNGGGFGSHKVETGKNGSRYGVGRVERCAISRICRSVGGDWRPLLSRRHSRYQLLSTVVSPHTKLIISPPPFFFFSLRLQR
ncbi:hypothetical protein ASPZODRAFT_1229082 [Penicilliopsis zonata CBS 506.65]|uniref:Uncharacterized protein n=1 Tax=Penicilliopsis zonata CBS 506.65 TaxID=1073090 RepID=A0A1L9S7Q1_9EURO|nr:hypothetical protein ASPZODRAFT_1229082 [Penicilliopsis zonata CBS 506.65]OJJ43154.1 hypothetical protein ASPZODRAFT_1229082 [Penicilliopsis zonata CBS 506.65]